MKTLTAILFMLSSLSSLAGVLTSGSMALVQDFSYTWSHSLWSGAEETPFVTNGEQATQKFFATSFNLFYGLPKHFQVDFKLNLTKTKISGGAFADAKEGDGHLGVSQVLIRIKQEIYHIDKFFDVIPYLAYSHPGRTSPKSPLFLGVNDYAEMFILGVVNAMEFKNFNINSDLSYSIRRGPPEDQFVWSLEFPIKILDEYRFGPSFNFTHTLGGLDAGSAEFAATLPPPFHRKRERFIVVGLFASKQWGRNSWGEIFLNRKIWGMNTNEGTTVGFALGYLVDAD